MVTGLAAFLPSECDMTRFVKCYVGLHKERVKLLLLKTSAEVLSDFHNNQKM